MRIVYLGAGAAGMYCGSCLHDNTLAAAMIAAGEEMLLVPTYTPLRTDEENVSQRRIFFGGINVYLQQKFAPFRYTPWFLDRLLDQPWLVDWLSRRGVNTDPAKLGDLTVSVLRGEEGYQRKEVAKLVRWLADQVQPDVLHLSNAMLMGMTHDIRRELSMPIVCTLSGEDVFLEKLKEPYYGQARDELRRRAEGISAFVALNRYYADFSADYLGVERERIHVIQHGLNLRDHGNRRPRALGAPITIGYLARICHDKGLHRLAEAFALLARDPDLPPLRLRAAGYLGAGDRKYLSEIRSQLAAAGAADRFEYAGELDRRQKIEFLQSLDVMSVPTVYCESKGISILEALANGVPVVLPAHGSFPEIVEDTGGGVLCDPDDTGELAAAIKRLVLDPAALERHGRQGREAIHTRYTAEEMARRTAELYRSVLPGPAASTAAASISSGG